MKILLFLLFSFFFFSCSHDPLPEGEGSYEDERKIKSVLSKLDVHQLEDTLPKGYYRIHFNIDSSYIVTGTNSHDRNGGGTIGVLFEDGSIFTHFGHVCGPGPTPLSFPGETKEEIILNIKQSTKTH